MTPEERVEAGGLAARLRALAQRIPFTGASEWWALRETYEDAMRQASDALEATERERDEAQQIAAKQIDEWVKGASQKLIDQRDTARAQVETLVEALRIIAGPCRSRCERYTAGSHKCIACIATDALEAAGVET